MSQITKIMIQVEVGERSQRKKGWSVMGMLQSVDKDKEDDERETESNSSCWDCVEEKLKVAVIWMETTGDRFNSAGGLCQD